MATWAMRKRYEWIEARLAAGGSFNREDIVEAFTVTKQTASATVSEFQALHPHTLRYDASRKAFVRADAPTLKSPNAWLLSLLYEAAKPALALLESEFPNQAPGEPESRVITGLREAIAQAEQA